MTRCPECRADIDTDGLSVGEVIDCSSCGVELEVIAVDPVEVAVIADSDEADVDAWSRHANLVSVV